MNAAFIAAMTALGLASGVHCVGMCSGIVTAFSLGNRGQSPISRLLALNAGRLATYAGAGALAGTLGWYAGSAQSALLVLANVVLVLVGLHLAGVRSPMLFFERLGTPLWRQLQPHAIRLMKTPGPVAALGTGMLWGALPCGLVYGALTAAAFAGSPAAGAASMLAFGLGTLPWLFAAGVAAARLRQWISRKPVRLTVGAIVAGFGFVGLAHAGTSYICS